MVEPDGDVIAPVHGEDCLYGYGLGWDGFLSLRYA